MPGIDDYLQSTPEEAKHPKVRYWEKRQSEGARLQCELVRERNGLSFGPTRLFVSFLDEHGGDIQSPDEIDWDAHINDELLRMGVRATIEKDEVLRFSLVLRDRLAEPEGQFGDGFFNAVLIEHIDEKHLSEEPVIHQKRALIREYKASRDGRSYYDCVAAIDAILVRCGQELMKLYADPQQVKRIFAGAVAEYLDERFSVTNRQILGLGSTGRR